MSIPQATQFVEGIVTHHEAKEGPGVARFDRNLVVSADRRFDIVKLAGVQAVRAGKGIRATGAFTQLASGAQELQVAAPPIMQDEDAKAAAEKNPPVWHFDLKLTGSSGIGAKPTDFSYAEIKDVLLPETQKLMSETPGQLALKLQLAAELEASALTDALEGKSPADIVVSKDLEVAAKAHREAWNVATVMALKGIETPAMRDVLDTTWRRHYRVSEHNMPERNKSLPTVGMAKARGNQLMAQLVAVQKKPSVGPKHSL